MHTSISYMKKKMAAASYFQNHSFPQIRNYTTEAGNNASPNNSNFLVSQ